MHLIIYWAFIEAGHCIQQLLKISYTVHTHHNKGARQRNIFLTDVILLVDKLMSIANNDVTGKAGQMDLSMASFGPSLE